ncbi:hypothetical protein [Amycolatopsis sp. NPDC058986]
MTVHARRYGRWCREHFGEPARPGAEAGPAPADGAAGPEADAEDPGQQPRKTERTARES